jgi:hypothetical protein
MFPSPTVSFAQGSERELIPAGSVQALKDAGTLIIDERRTRTRYFDGRFLAAKDEIRDQNYFLTRLADLGRAGGAGVVAGLLVTRTTSGSVTIGAGQGVTPAGETVTVGADLTVTLENVALAEQLDVAFGLSRIPSPLARNRTGLFVIALRPVEYTANPVASYPTTINGARSIQDGDVIEAAAVVLVPYIEQGQQGSADTRQSRVARSIFLEEAPTGLPEDVLPLAVIAMNTGTVQWVDPYLVRRELGASQGNVLGFGFANRPLREAFVQQYLNQLNQVLQTQSGAVPRFPATQYFVALPSAGLLPSAAIDPSDFSQIFFPPQIQTDISIVPDDELAVLVEESFLLPPIDLTAAADELESTSILVLVPVPRTQLPTLKATLSTLLSPLRPAAPGMVFQRRPIDALRGLLSVRLPPPTLDTGSLQDRAWRAALALNPLLWYVRRRNLQVRQDIVGTSVSVSTNELATDQAVTTNLTNAGLLTRFDALKARTSSAALADLTARLSSPAVASNPILAASVISALEKAPQIDRATVLQATEPLTDPKLGEGLAQLRTSNPGLSDPQVMQAVADSGAAAQLDTIGRTLDKTKLTDVTNQVIAIAKTGGADAASKIAALLKANTPAAKSVITLQGLVK